MRRIKVKKIRFGRQEELMLDEFNPEAPVRLQVMIRDAQNPHLEEVLKTIQLSLPNFPRIHLPKWR